MNAALIWTRSNIIVVVSGALCLVSLIALLIIHVAGESFVRDLKGRDATITEIRELRKGKVDLPSPELDRGKPDTRMVGAINPELIRKISKLYEEIDGKHQKLFMSFVEKNREGHVSVIDGIFPDPGPNQYILYEIGKAYRNACDQMVRPYSPHLEYPRLDAGTPLSPIEIDLQMDRVEDSYFRGLFPPKNSLNDLTDQQRDKLRMRKSRRKRELMADHARRFHIYAETDSRSNGYPFQIGDWTDPSEKPTLSEVWIGHMVLWIQQDIVKAIGKANQVQDSSKNVITAPVKRLRMIEVLEGYLGISNTKGGLDAKGQIKRGRAGSSLAPQATDRRRPRSAKSKRGAVKIDFSRSPTGRRSNSTYDIWHAWLTVDVDIRYLPVLFEKLQETNYMSILAVELEDLPEYALWEQGYFYGLGDMVQVRILIETVWFRQWTKALMPTEIKVALGIIKRKDGSSGDAAGLVGAAAGQRGAGRRRGDRGDRER